MTNDTPAQLDQENDLNAQMAQRRQKLNDMRQQGQAYPNHFRLSYIS